MHTLINDVYLATYRIWNRKWITLLCMILSAVSLGLLSSVVSLSAFTYEAEHQAKELLSLPVEQCGYVCLNGYFNKETDIAEDYGNVEAFSEKLMDLPSVYTCGWLQAYGVSELYDEKERADLWRTVAERQHKLPLPFRKDDWSIEEDDWDSFVMGYVFPQSMWKAFNIPLAEGDAPRGDETLIYLGYELRNTIDIGSYLHYEDDEYYIAGSLKKGANMFDDSFLFMNHSMENGGSIQQNSTVSLDNLILIVIPDTGIISERELILWNKGYEIEDVEEQIQELISPYDVTVQVSAFQTKMDADLAFNKYFQKPLIEIGVVIGCVLVLLLICIQMLSILYRKNDLGILLTQGISRISLYHILLFENMIPISVAAICSPVITRGIVLNSLQGIELQLSLIRIAFFPVLILLVLMVLLLSATSSLLVIMLLKHSSSANLIKGEIWHSNVIYFGLYLFAFIITFSIIYYSLYLRGVASKVENVQKTADYNYLAFDFESIEDGQMEEFLAYHLKSEEGCFTALRTELPVNGRAFQSFIQICIDQREPMLYPLSEGCYPVGENYASTPSCVIGEGYLPDVYVDHGKQYILIDQIPFQVTGILACNHFAGQDFRIITYYNTLTEDTKERICKRDETRLICYGNPDLGYSEKNEYYLRFLDFFGEEGLYSVTEYSDSDSDAIDISSNISSMYRGVCNGMIVLSLINLLFISLLWGAHNQLKHMIFFVNGYSRKKIMLYDTCIILSYEITALILVVLGVIIIDLFKASPMVMVFVEEGKGLFCYFVIFGIATAFFGTIRLFFEKPAVVLKHSE